MNPDLQILVLSKDLDALTATVGELRHAVSVLLRRIEALEQRAANLEAANAARAWGCEPAEVPA